MSIRRDRDAGAISPDQSASSDPPARSRRAARPSVYDAVAGRVSSDRYIRHDDFIPSTRDTTSSSKVPLAPEEILFKSVNAPPLYEDVDIYNHDLRLAGRLILPESDLLKAIHAYTADFYASTSNEDAHLSYKSLDCTALLALGILFEESCKAALGETGDLALTKVSDEARLAPETMESESVESWGQGAMEGSTRPHKKMRVSKSPSPDSSRV